MCLRWPLVAPSLITVLSNSFPDLILPRGRRTLECSRVFLTPLCLRCLSHCWKVSTHACKRCWQFLLFYLELEFHLSFFFGLFFKESCTQILSYSSLSQVGGNQIGTGLARESRCPLTRCQRRADSVSLTHLVSYVQKVTRVVYSPALGSLPLYLADRGSLPRARGHAHDTPSGGALQEERGC